jgi:beta-N-acetylhexosaminidase
MKTADTMTVEDLAGQRIMAGFDGTGMNDDLAHLIEDVRVGGLILFSQNIRTPDQVADLCRSAQKRARKSGCPPLLMAVDQEGGVVARLKAPHFTEFDGNPSMAGPEDADRFAHTTAGELLSVGLNMDMAPVMDVAPPAAESVMANRVFGTSPGVVAEMGTAVIRGLQRSGVMAVAKHFPGIGRTLLDSHLDRPVFSEPAESIHAFELPPFKAAIEANVAGIMLSHIVYDQLDPLWPASLSPIVARDLLRAKMGYQGVVMTDDLDMGAIVNHYDIDTIVHQTLEADIDLVLICHKGPNIDLACRKIQERLRRNADMKRRGIDAARRLLDLKARYIDLL